MAGAWVVRASIDREDEAIIFMKETSFMVMPSLLIV
jgi:hypothetical protein